MGVIGIYLKISLLSQYLKIPSVGHLYQAFRVFAYPKFYLHSRVVMDLSTVDCDEGKFFHIRWSGFYPD